MGCGWRSGATASYGAEQPVATLRRAVHCINFGNVFRIFSFRPFNKLNVEREIRNVSRSRKLMFQFVQFNKFDDSFRSNQP